MRRGFTLTEMLVVIIIIALLCAILLPVFFIARRRGQQTMCAANLRQLSAASLMYAQDSDGVLPCDNYRSSTDWYVQVLPYVEDKQVFTCPVCVVPNYLPDYEPVRGYAENGNINSASVSVGSSPVRESDVRFATSTVLFAEVHFLQLIQNPGQVIVPRYSVVSPDVPNSGPANHLDDEIVVVGMAGGLRHSGGSNYAFVDGHVKWHKPDAVDWRENDENGYPLPPPERVVPLVSVEVRKRIAAALLGS